jgi:WD40-like Beta Propeller Repeat
VLVSIRRFTSSVLVWLCLSSGVGLMCGAPAFAAAPEAPTVEVWGRNSTEVTMRGVLYPNNTGEPGSYEFLYKQSASECTGGSKTASGIATGNQFEEKYETLTGLTPGKQYTACMSVTSPEGTTLSSLVTITTAIPPETPEGLKAESVAAFGATLHGVLNPLAERKAEPGGYEFLYRKSATECEGEGQTPSTAAAGERAEAVSAPVVELLPHTQYTFCLRAFNEAGESATSTPVTFKTLAAAPKIEEAGAVRVTAESATFQATVDPEGAATTYTFEYASAGGAFVPLATAEGNGTLVEGTAGVPLSAHVQGLLAHTAYEFRLVATNAVETVTGVPVSFTTQTADTSFALPDGRQWEMVSPPQKEGALILPIREGTMIQAAADGNAFVGESLFEPTEGNAAGAYGFFETDFFGRGANGWVADTLTPPHSGPGLAPIGNGDEYWFFSRDLSKGLLQPFGPATPLASNVSHATPYIRVDYLGGQGETCGSGCYTPLVNDNNVPPGTQYGGPGEENGPCTYTHCGPEVLAASPDLSHVLLASPVALTSGSNGGLYEWAAGEVTFVGEGGVAASEISRHVFSDYGTRVFINGTYKGVSGLLMRDIATNETVQIAPGSFADASSDGSKVFLYNNGELFEYDLNAPVGERLTDLSVDPNQGEGAGVSAVIGASEDGSYVYFAATGALAPGATPATCSGSQPCTNLYVHHDGVTSFVAGLSTEDGPDVSISPSQLTARVSPNGRWFAFMSNRDLTGYSPTDAVSGRPDEEVYLYDASTEKLVCASCNPTGARPVGTEYGGNHLVDGESGFGSNTWIAASVPGWTNHTVSSASYQSRYLSDEGRLFFNSHDALIPQDVNGTEDVYEYEPSGVGNCSGTKDTFSRVSGGCASLMSSGESNEETAFLDASETGGDVFFLTTAKLVSRDFDNTFDVYDARECGANGSRCLAREPASPPPCETGDACKPSPSPQPTIFESPASATFSGAGNVKPAAGATPTVKKRSLTRKQLLARALGACHRRKGTRRRVCERDAHRRYGATQRRIANTTRRGGR